MRWQPGIRSMRIRVQDFPCLLGVDVRACVEQAVLEVNRPVPVAADP